MDYEIYDEAALLARTEQKTASDFLKSATDLSSLLPPSRYGDAAAPFGQKKHSRVADVEGKDLKLKELEFANCMINKISVRKFVMKNGSGIRAPFNLRSQHYEPLRYLDQVIPPTAPAAEATMRGTPSSKKSGFDMTERSMLSDPIVCR